VTPRKVKNANKVWGIKQITAKLSQYHQKLRSQEPDNLEAKKET